MDRIVCRGRQFVDEQGRVRVLRGMNLVCKDPALGYVGSWSEEDFAAMARMGTCVVRLGLAWRALEPSPGTIDDNYIARMEAILDRCERWGFYVLLDMHQDLYGGPFGDGAPDWATLTDGLPGPEPGAVWSDAYLTCPSVSRAFDHLWANDPAPDGVGLQDHLAACWQRVAARWGSRPVVLGYDLLNEPFPGSAAAGMFGALLTAFAVQAGSDYSGPEDVLAAFTTAEGRDRALKLVDDPQRFAALARAAAAPVAEFDREVLASFFRRMAAAVRAGSPDGILFMENNYVSNMGTPSGLPLLPDENQQAYAPHGYDLVVDTAMVGSGASNARAGVIFESHRQVQERLGIPVLAGEWGAFGWDPSAGHQVRFLLDLFDRMGWSWTYWDWAQGYDRSPAALLMARPAPRALAGQPVRWGMEGDDRFICVWDEDDAGNDSLFIIPGWEWDVELTPPGGWQWEPDRGIMCLTVPSVGGRRTLTLTRRS